MFDENQEVMDHLYLVEKIVKGEFNHVFYYLSYDELFSLGLEGLLVGVRSYKGNVDKEIHYAQNIRFKVRRAISDSIAQIQRAERYDITTHSITKRDGTDLVMASEVDEFVKIELNDMLQHWTKDLSTSEIEVVNFLLLGYKQSEIAQKMGITQQAVSKKVQVTRAKIENQIKEG